MRRFVGKGLAVLISLGLSSGAARAGGRLDFDPELDVRENGSALRFFRNAALLVGASAALDGGLREDLFGGRNEPQNRFLRGVGDNTQLAGPALGTLFLLHGLGGNPKSTQTAILAYQSFLLSGGIAWGLKTAVGRARPSQTAEPGSYGSRQGDSSFPSGHTTTAFAAATVVAEQYPKWYVVIPAYGIAAATGYSRLASNKHWASDVAAGAAIGWGTAHWLGQRSRKRDKGRFYPTANGVGYTKEF